MPRRRLISYFQSPSCRLRRPRRFPYLPAPHPHVAALFVDFLLSKPGQDLMASQGRWASRNDVGYLVDLKGKKMQIPSSDWDDKQVELIKLYNSVFSLR